MILFIEIIVALGLVMFPIVRSFLNGAMEYEFFIGFVLGTNYDAIYFQALIDGEKKNFKLHTIQFHLICLTISMAWSKPADIIVEEE